MDLERFFVVVKPALGNFCSQEVVKLIINSINSADPILNAVEFTMLNTRCIVSLPAIVS